MLKNHKFHLKMSYILILPTKTFKDIPQIISEWTTFRIFEPRLVRQVYTLSLPFKLPKVWINIHSKYSGDGKASHNISIYNIFGYNWNIVWDFIQDIQEFKIFLVELHCSFIICESCSKITQFLTFFLLEEFLLVNPLHFGLLWD